MRNIIKSLLVDAKSVLQSIDTAYRSVTLFGILNLTITIDGRMVSTYTIMLQHVLLQSYYSTYST